MSESLWSGPFGDAYNDRNPPGDRRAFWAALLARHPIHSVLEVGCGQGPNLAAIAGVISPLDVYGIDINAQAVARARETGANVLEGSARSLPFRDGLVDLAFTAGVLIHQPDDALSDVMREVIRCSRRYVLWAEYQSAETEEIPYHGERGALFKRDYARLYRDLGLELVEGGLLSIADYDEVDWQLLTLR